MKDILEIKDVLEILYLISGPSLVLIGYLALSQIRIAREQLDEQRNATIVSSKRDALRLTSEQIVRYGKEIIQLQNQFNDKVKSKGVKYFDESSIKITGKKIQVIPCSADEEKEKLYSLMGEFTDVMNAMEGFSIYFVSGVADEMIAYRSLSNTYCSFIKKLLPLLVPMISGENRFSATMQLFHIWNARLESESLQKQKEDLEKKLKDNKSQAIEIVGYNA